jgi:hypothetical protein
MATRLLTIWKYQIRTTDLQTIEMPEGARILSVQVQHGAPTVWALVDPANPLVERMLIVCGTGNPCPSNLGAYVGTYQLQGGALVFHVFEAES